MMQTLFALGILSILRLVYTQTYQEPGKGITVAPISDTEIPPEYQGRLQLNLLAKLSPGSFLGKSFPELLDLLPAYSGIVDNGQAAGRRMDRRRFKRNMTKRRSDRRMERGTKS